MNLNCILILILSTIFWGCPGDNTTQGGEGLRGTRGTCFEFGTSETGARTINKYLTSDHFGPCPKDVIIPEGIEIIEEEAFAGENVNDNFTGLALTSVIFPNSVLQVKSMPLRETLTWPQFIYPIPT